MRLLRTKYKTHDFRSNDLLIDCTIIKRKTVLTENAESSHSILNFVISCQILWNITENLIMSETKIIKRGLQK